MEFIGYRVVTASSPGMATQDATTCQIETLQRSMLLDGFHCIAGASGSEPTSRWQQGRNASPIEVNGKKEEIGEEGGKHF
jgi:hypothetical protein